MVSIGPLEKRVRKPWASISFVGRFGMAGISRAAWFGGSAVRLAGASALPPPAGACYRAFESE